MGHFRARKFIFFLSYFFLRDLVAPTFRPLLIELASPNLAWSFLIRFLVSVFKGFSKFQFFTVFLTFWNPGLWCFLGVYGRPAGVMLVREPCTENIDMDYQLPIEAFTSVMTIKQLALDPGSAPYRRVQPPPPKFIKYSIIDLGTWNLVSSFMEGS